MQFTTLFRRLLWNVVTVRPSDLCSIGRRVGIVALSSAPFLLGTAIGPSSSFVVSLSTPRVTECSCSLGGVARVVCHVLSVHWFP